MMKPASTRMVSGVNLPLPDSSIGDAMNNTPPTKPSIWRHSATRERSSYSPERPAAIAVCGISTSVHPSVITRYEARRCAMPESTDGL
jgi:hypothetical protein